MIALDMDGTTLNDQKIITTYTKHILEKAMEEGVVVLACTGRPANAIPKVFTELKGVQYAISSNGARVVDVKNNQVVYSKLLNSEDTKNIINMAQKYDTYQEIFWEGQGYTTGEMYRNIHKYLNAYMKSYIGKTRKFVEDLEEEIKKQHAPCDKVHLVFGDLEEREQAKKDLLRLGNFEYNGAIENNMEITAPGTSKGTSIIKLGEILGIKREEIMAIGDGMNDASMLQEVGLPIAMANSVDEIKEMASYITDNNNEDGVGKAINKFVLNEKE